MTYNSNIIFIVFWLLATVTIINSQDFRYDYNLYFGANVALNIKMGKNAGKQNFPGIKTFVGFNASNRIKLQDNTVASLNIGSSITLYNKSLGNSLNLNYQDNQIDWTSNVTAGIGWGEDTDRRHLQTINNSPFYNLQHDKTYAVHIGSNFIMNNHRRHQTNGSFSLTTERFSMTYYNDGGPFFNWGFGDSFDRYWTGGLILYLHDARVIEGEGVDKRMPFNRVEFSFDQFTGYHPQMYELTGIFGADIQDYDLYRQAGTVSSGRLLNLPVQGRDGYDYNASAYRLTYNHNEFLGGFVGVIGSLRDHRTERYYALQDIIHVVTRAPIHPNRSVNRLQIGFNYNNRLWDYSGIVRQ